MHLSFPLLDCERCKSKPEASRYPSTPTKYGHYFILDRPTSFIIMSRKDERFRTSTQYRLWSYSPESLAALRATTTELAATRVREAISRSRESADSAAPSSVDTSEAETNGDGTRKKARTSSDEVECLTADEELELITYYCRQTIDLGTHFKVPTEVKVQLSSLPAELMIHLTIKLGNSCTIHQAFLHHQFSNDLPSKSHPENCAILCDQNREPLHQHQRVCSQHSQNEA